MPEPTRNENNINSSLDRSNIILRKLLQECKKSGMDHELILNMIKNELDNIRSDMQNNVNKYKKVMNAQLEYILKKNEFLCNELQSAAEENRRNSDMYDVMLRGIPYEENEELLTLFSGVANAIGFEHDYSIALNDIFRVSTNKSQKCAPILVKFKSVILKGEFMERYFQKDCLLLKDITTTSDNRRVYATDNSN